MSADTGLLSVSIRFLFESDCDVLAILHFDHAICAGGFTRANQIVRDHWGPMIRVRSGEPGQRDFKTRLQETLVAEGRTIEYTVTETGPQHAKHFAAIARSSGEDLASGSGTSKKRAEQDAARRALEVLDGTEPE